MLFSVSLEKDEHAKDASWSDYNKTLYVNAVSFSDAVVKAVAWAQAGWSISGISKADGELVL